MTEKIDPERIKNLLAKQRENDALRQKLAVKARPFRTASSDAQSIKGKVVDDSQIADKKALVYNSTKDKIEYRRVGGGGGGGGSGNATSILGVDVDDSGIGDDKVLTYNAATGKLEYTTPAGGGDMVKADYDVDSNNVVDNSQKLEGFSLAQVRNHAPQAHTHPVADLTDHNKAAHDALNINADTVDGIHASGFLSGTWVTGSCSGSNPITKAHGLGGTPSLVLCLPNALQPYVVSYNADVTNIIFYHNAAGSLTIKYAAKL